MKISVRNKVANGLVLCLLVPKLAASASNFEDQVEKGLEAFSASDDFDLALNSDTQTAGKQKNLKNGDPTGGDPTGGDPSGYDPSGFDPSGFDPSGGDPSGCVPGAGTAAPAISIEAPSQLLTAEDGTSDLLQVSMSPDPETSQTFHFVSTNPAEAQPVPNVVELGENACIPQSVWVVGQNDYVQDGDQDFVIDVYDNQDTWVDSFKGVNLDNDNYSGVTVDVLGPSSLPPGDVGLYLVRVANVSQADIKKNTLIIAPTGNLEIYNYAAAYFSGDPLKAKAKTKDGQLTFKKIKIAAGDMLIVSLEVEMAKATPDPQTLAARFVSPDNRQSDDEQDIRTAVWSPRVPPPPTDGR